MSKFYWSSELKETENLATGQKRYFIRICGHWRRVSKDSFYGRCSSANRCDSYYSVTKGNVRHWYKTVYGIHESKS